MDLHGQRLPVYAAGSLATTAGCGWSYWCVTSYSAYLHDDEHAADGTQLGVVESNIRQLWSLTFLSVRRNEAFR